MKFIDTFTEDDKKKLIKKAKLVFSVLKKGTITRSDGVSFSYLLGDNMKPIVVDGEIEIFAFISKIIEKTYCPLSIHAIKELIIKKFEHFNINAEFYNTDNTQIEKYQGKKPWEEPLNEEIDRSYLKKLKKKGELVYKLYKKGKLVSDREDGELHYTYELSDKKLINAYGDEISVSPDNIKIKYHNELTNKFALLPITDSIKKRFHNHGITLNIPRWTEIYIDKWEEHLNEEMDIDKERKRVKTIHKAIRKGIVNFEGNRYRYELPEEYTFHMVNKLAIEIKSIKFTFYNKDLSMYNEGGHGLPLKIWRIEDGKDVYLNKILSPQDVGDICYNDEYNINTKTGVEYVNVKNKVRNKYRDFNINAIMTTPSDTVMVNESTDDYTQKQIKKAKTIYKALRKGTIGGDDPEEPHFTYILSDDFSVHTTNAGIVISLQKIKIKHLNRGCLLHSTDYMGSLIRKRFNLFGIILTNPYKDLYFDYEVDDWESPLNEGAEVLNPESLSNNEIKKVKTLYKLLKKGHFKYDDARSTYGYILPENYYIYKDELGDICIKLTGEEETKMLSKVKMARPSDNFDILILPEYTNLHDWIKTKVIEKFDGFNIKFIF